MVIALFIQILVMIIDRYMYKSKTFIQVQQSHLSKMEEKIEKHTQEQRDKDNANEGGDALRIDKGDQEGERGMSVVHFLSDNPNQLVARDEHVNEFESTPSE